MNFRQKKREIIGACPPASRLTLFRPYLGTDIHTEGYSFTSIHIHGQAHIGMKKLKTVHVVFKYVSRNQLVERVGGWWSNASPSTPPYFPADRWISHLKTM